MEVTRPILKIYKGFSNRETTHVIGHVLRRSTKPIEKVSRNPFKNALQMVRRYQVKPAADELLSIKTGTQEYTVRSSVKGYFEFVFPTPSGQRFSCSVQLERGDIIEHLDMEVSNPEVVVVSDLDDTILVSHSTNLLKKLYLLLTKNHERRKGFDGIKKFYEGLLNENGKLFYVSSSEWNLYDFLLDFMDYNRMPQGVFLLQNLKTGIGDLFKSGGGSHMHKIDKIQKILNAYQGVPFVLVGDSGQKDPEIYQKIVAENPGRISQVYIRDVKRSKKRKLKQFADTIEQYGVRFQILNR